MASCVAGGCARPTIEICDGIDNDLDGEIDEDCCTDEDRDGICAEQDCDDTDAEIREGSPEVCDGVDNDCDGQIDEDFDLGSDPLNCGACGSMCDRSEECLNGACEPLCLPEEEICDGIDNDCDGMIDEGCEGPGEPCDEDADCGFGQVCVNGICMDLD